MPSHESLITALRSSPTLLNELGDLLEAGVLTVDADLVIRGWNHWLETASGRSAADVVGQPLLEVFPELRGTQREAVFRDALSGRTVVLSHRLHRYLLPFAPGAGFESFERMQQSARLMPILGSDQRAEAALAVIQDVTERVAGEDELRAATQRAEEASRAKSEFLAAMSHELRTPLGAVVGYADLLAGGYAGAVTELQKDRLSRIKQSAWHLLSIVEQILTFSRADAGRETFALETCDACEVAREAAALLEPQASQRGLTLTLVPPDEPLTIVTDRTKLRQVLVNLLGNAVKFTDAGSVTLELRRDADRIRLLVHDTGPGIAAEDRERIFEPFTRLDHSGTRTRAGTGLGLPVSRKLARLLGGDLTVESEPGVGSTFTMWIPVPTERRTYPAPPTGSASTA